MIDIVKKHIIGSVVQYENVLADLIATKKAIKVKGNLETELLDKISLLADEMGGKLHALEKSVEDSKLEMSPSQKRQYYTDVLVKAMNELRKVVDQLETLIDNDYWALPTYNEILFSVM